MIQTGEPLPGDEDNFRPMRAINLCRYLVQRGHSVTLWSSDFNHFTKTFRNGKTTIREIEGFQLITLRSSGYKKNIGLARLVDHFFLAIQARLHLRGFRAPDVAFIGFPPIEIAWVFAKWFRSRNTPFVLDVKDKWPDIFVSSIPRRLSTYMRVLLGPYFVMSRTIVQLATGVCSISKPLLNWSLEKGNKDSSEFDFVAPLVSPEQEYNEAEEGDTLDWFSQRGINLRAKTTLYFAGTINSAFDFDPLIYLATQCDLQIVLAGDGPLREFWMKKTTLIPNMFWPGRISAGNLRVLAKNSKLAIAPYSPSKDFDLHITNKIFDAMKFGIPLAVSGSKEMESFVTESGIGFSYDASTTRNLAEKYMQLDSVLLDEMSRTTRSLYLEEFEYNRVYGLIESKLSQLSQSTVSVMKRRRFLQEITRGVRRFRH